MASIALDVGNTRAKSGLFAGTELQETREWETSGWDDFVKYATNRNAAQIIYSTVGVELGLDWLSRFPEEIRLLELSEKSPLPFTNEYRSPETLGKDRVAAIAGAQALFPEENVLVIDAGTCITFDLLRADGHYLGGNISPGLEMRYRAMHTFTARLPWVQAGSGNSFLGKTTKEALQQGGLTGIIAEVTYYQQELAKEFGSLVTLMTGGDAPFLAEKLKSRIFVHPHLVLRGLNQILTFNEEGSE